MKKKNKNDTTQIKSGIQHINIVDLILMDHRYIKECVEVLRDEKADKKKKLSYAKGFIKILALHSLAEKKSVYTPLVSNQELHFNILEAEIEHGIVDQKVKLLKNKIIYSRYLTDEMEAELKVLAELVKHHIVEEESEFLPKLKEEIDDESLVQMGAHFTKLRKLTPKDLQAYPLLQNELIQWKDSIQKVSSEFLTKMDKFVESLHH